MKSIVITLDLSGTVYLKFFPNKTYLDSCHIFYKLVKEGFFKDKEVDYTTNHITFLKEVCVPIEYFDKHIVLNGDSLIFKPNTYTGVTYLLDQNIDVLPYCTFLFEHYVSFNNITDTSFINSESSRLYLVPRPESYISVRIVDYYKMSFLSKLKYFKSEERKLLSSFIKSKSLFLEVHITGGDNPKIGSVTNFKSNSEIPYMSLKKYLKTSKYLYDTLNISFCNLQKEEFIRFLRCNIDFNKYSALVCTPHMSFIVREHNFE